MPSSSSPAETKKKYTTRLHALIARGPVPSKSTWQDSILTYLTQNCTVSNSLFKKEQTFYFPSPLPINAVAKNALLNELKTKDNGDTPLLLAVRHNCTSDVIAALCHLCPEAAKISDETGLLPLHIAAKEPSIASTKKKKPEGDISQIIKILVEANPAASVSRCHLGKTPLHYLIEYHPETRSLATVELFGRIVEEKVWIFEVETNSQPDNEKVPLPIPSVIKRKLPKQAESMNLYTPASALVIPDTVLGAIPLHYAVKNGISKEVIAYLIKAYPGGACQVDYYHRTPLHWILRVQGRKLDVEEGKSKVPSHHIYRSSSIILMLLQQDLPEAYNVASIKDFNTKGDLHRTPLHYAVELLAKNIVDPAQSDGKPSSSCVALKSLKALIDADSKALITKDSLGQTPLHVLFRTIFELNDAQYKKTLHIATTGYQATESPKALKPFTPPRILVELLIQGSPQEPTNPSTVSDIRGLLPLHCAVLAISSPTTLKILIQSNPSALTHVTNSLFNEYISKYYDLLPSNDPFYICCFEGSRTPLHMAFANPYFINAYHENMIHVLLAHYSVTNDANGSSQSKTNFKVDAKRALRIQDQNGNTPLHLAAKHNASFERLAKLLNYDISASKSLNEFGDLPLHLLLDKHFLFVNAELLTAHSRSKDDANLECKERVRELAKKQTVAIRMNKFQLCGAIFAPNNGWTNVDEETSQRDQDQVMKKINLLGMPLINDAKCLQAPSSLHGLLPIHILIAFHAAPYQIIAHMLDVAPASIESCSTPEGYTALDLHLLRRKIPREVLKSELDSWKAIQQLLIIYGLFPLESFWKIKSGGLYDCVHDEEFILECERQVLAEVKHQMDASYHLKRNQPVEPKHITFGFLNHIKGQEEDNKDITDHDLSAVCEKFWVFMTCYYNLSNPENNFSQSVRRILAQLDFDDIEMLMNLKLPSNTFQKNFDSSQIIDFPSYTVDNYANVFCKAEIHSHRYFAGLYTFIPPVNGGTILLHRDRSNQSIFLQGKQLVFKINSQNNHPLMFTPTSDVRYRSDYTVNEIPVCFKFTKSQAVFKTEVKWREILKDLSKSSSIISIIDSYDVESSDKNMIYIKHREDKRFRKMPLRLHSAKTDSLEWVNLTHYPFAVVFPLSTDGNLCDVLRRGLLDSSAVKSMIIGMAYLLNNLHKKGVIHGSFGARNILSFPIQIDGLWSREWKLAGINCVIPTYQKTAFLGAISPSGLCSYESSILPPEMFKKLDSLELSFYNSYWRAVTDLANVNIPWELVAPRIDPETGDAYVVKCYCNLDETTAQSLPTLPYELIEASPSVDLWSFGVFLFTLVTGGETLFHSNMRMGTISSMEFVVKWSTDLAVLTVQQNVDDHIAQDILIHLLSPIEHRSNMDMDLVLQHPYFASDSLLPKDVIKALADARDKHSDDVKLRMQKDQSDEKKEMNNGTTTLSRLSTYNQLLIVNSITEVIRDAFDPKHAFPNTVPYSFIVLPYKLAMNKAGKLIPTAMSDVEVTERLGRQLLELIKATCFASSFKEFYLHSTRDSREEKIQFWSTSLIKYPMETAEDILKTIYLDPKHFLHIASEFVSTVRSDNTLSSNPIESALELLHTFVDPIIDTFRLTGKAYLYPVDEYYGKPVVGGKAGRQYPHSFNNDVEDVAYKFLPYTVTCITRMMSASGSVESLVKLIFEGASPNTPDSWVKAAKGIPTVFMKQRMVSEALILREATQKMIRIESPIALYGKRELDFIHTLFTYIDGGADFGGLQCVSDGRSRMWTVDRGVEVLKQDCSKQTDPNYLYSLYKKEEEESDLIKAKTAEIAELKKKMKWFQSQFGEYFNPAEKII